MNVYPALACDGLKEDPDASDGFGGGGGRLGGGTKVGAARAATGA